MKISRKGIKSKKSKKINNNRPAAASKIYPQSSAHYYENKQQTVPPPSQPCWECKLVTRKIHPNLNIHTNVILSVADETKNASAAGVRCDAIVGIGFGDLYFYLEGYKQTTTTVLMMMAEIEFHILELEILSSAVLCFCCFSGVFENSSSSRRTRRSTKFYPNSGPLCPAGGPSSLSASSSCVVGRCGTTTITRSLIC